MENQKKYAIILQARVEMLIEEGKTKKEAWTEVLQSEGMSEEQIQKITENI